MPFFVPPTVSLRFTFVGRRSSGVWRGEEDVPLRCLNLVCQLLWKKVPPREEHRQNKDWRRIKVNVAVIKWNESRTDVDVVI